jgi:hypothetical protein
VCEHLFDLVHYITLFSIQFAPPPSIQEEEAGSITEFFGDLKGGEGTVQINFLAGNTIDIEQR